MGDAVKATKKQKDRIAEVYDTGDRPFAVDDFATDNDVSIALKLLADKKLLPIYDRRKQVVIGFAVSEREGDRIEALLNTAAAEQANGVVEDAP